MSITTVGVASSAGRSLVAPRNVRRASSSPSIVRASRPWRSRTAVVNAAPLPASRTALVSTATFVTAPSSSMIARYSRRTAWTRSIASWASSPDASTPWPSRVTVGAPLELLDAVAVDLGDEQAGRVRPDVDDGDLARGGVRHRLAGERGQEVVDGHVGHPRAGIVVAEPMCGTTRMLGASSSGSSAGSGSGSVTSSAAAAMVPSCSAVRERGLVDEAAAGGVHEDRGRLHRGERVGVDQVARLGGERGVQRDDVGVAQRCFVVVVAPDERRRPSRSPRRAARRRCPMRPAPMIASVAPVSFGHCVGSAPTSPRGEQPNWSGLRMAGEGSTS